MFGRKRLLFVGTLLVVVGALVCFLATGVQAMWVGQALSGLGAGVLFPTSLTMIAAAAPSTEGRARAIALWAGFLSLGAVISPLLAGVFGVK